MNQSYSKKIKEYLPYINDNEINEFEKKNLTVLLILKI